MVDIPKENLAVIILAAGLGKRMNDPEKPKAMAEIDGKPLIEHVIEKADTLTDNEIFVVVGHKKQFVIDYISLTKYKVIFIEQAEQLGTGHAVDQAKDNLSSFDGEALILCGDVPNLSVGTLRRFIGLHFENKADASVLTAIASDPYGYGRIVRDGEDVFVKIVEEKDAVDEQKRINEINSGVFLVRSELLFSALSKVSNRNAQGEYYLTDIVDILKNSGSEVFAFPIAKFEEILGVNSQDDLLMATSYYESQKN